MSIIDIFNWLYQETVILPDQEGAEKCSVNTVNFSFQIWVIGADNSFNGGLLKLLKIMAIIKEESEIYLELVVEFHRFCVNSFILIFVVNTLF